ncbi:MAG: NlpC/P60 family protein [Thomasclavelia sp.]|jgi:cell wall-associated NlpC family hydrolase|nr:NlpC/P60 family protein [Thomasclavelia sp.]
MDSVKTKLNNLYKNHIEGRKAMFFPMLAVGAFMLVGYAATDKEAPTINTNEVNLSYGEKLDQDMLNIEDNSGDASVKIDSSSLDNEQLGTYKVNVEATDDFANKTTKTVKVNVVDDKAPTFETISGSKGYVIETPVNGSNEVTSYIKAMDNVDGDVSDFIEADKQLDTSKEGSQTIQLTVEDTAGNKITKKFNFVVGDYEAPTMTLTKGENVVVNVNDTFNINDYVTVSDNLDTNLAITTDKDIDTSKEGEKYELKVSSVDSSKNETTKKLNVEIKDSKSANIVLSTNATTVNKGDAFDAKSFITSAIDTKDGDVKDKVTFNIVDVNTTGDKTVTYSYKDSAGNESKVDLKVTVQLSGQAFVNTGMTKLGCPYVWGATGPNTFDCSGFTQWVYAQNGISIPRTSGEQRASAKTVVPVSEAEVGDILWRNGHVGIYIGNGQYIHAPHTGDVVKVSSLSSSSFTNALRYK